MKKKMEQSPKDMMRDKKMGGKEMPMERDEYKKPGLMIMIGLGKKKGK